MDAVLLSVVIAAAIVILATVSAWIEVNAERRDQFGHRRVLRREPSYRRHVRRRRGEGAR